MSMVPTAARRRSLRRQVVLVVVVMYIIRFGEAIRVLAVAFHSFFNVEMEQHIQSGVFIMVIVVAAVPTNMEWPCAA